MRVLTNTYRAIGDCHSVIWVLVRRIIRANPHVIANRREAVWISSNINWRSGRRISHRHLGILEHHLSKSVRYRKSRYYCCNAQQQQCPHWETSAGWTCRREKFSSEEIKATSKSVIHNSYPSKPRRKWPSPSNIPKDWSCQRESLLRDFRHFFAVKIVGGLLLRAFAFTISNQFQTNKPRSEIFVTPQQLRNPFDIVLTRPCASHSFF